MDIYKNETSKILEIWMTNADQKDEACAAKVKQLIKKWHDKGFLPVVYKSGSEGLTENTSALLVTNRNRAARREVERERAAKNEEKPSVIEKLHRPTAPAKTAAMGKRRDDLSL